MSRLLILAFSVFALSGTTQAATMAFMGKIVEVKDPDSKQAKEIRKIFTTEIAYYDYCSRGSFGKDSEPGERTTQQVRKLGTVCMIDGQLVNSETFAKAIAPGMWAYVYEDTWIDLRTTPDYRWGEVVLYQDGKLVLREHRTHKDVHLPKNPPVESNIEVADSTPLPAGTWVQVHEGSPTVVSGFNKASNYNPKEWLPFSDGKRGYANDLTCPAILTDLKTESPNAVSDIRVTLMANRLLSGDWKNAEKIVCKKTTFILDGKPVPPVIGFAKDRSAILGHYRKEESPHKIFASTNTPEENVSAERLSEFPEGTVFRLNGLPAKREDLEGSTIRVFPGSKSRRVVVLPATKTRESD